MLPYEMVERVTVNLLHMAVTSLPSDVIDALERARDVESNQVARTQLDAILENVGMARESAVPLCQDTGIPLFFISGGVGQPLDEQIRRGVERATGEVPLRPNVVHPLTRGNPGNNVGHGLPHVHYAPTDEEYIEITVLPKGAGSENMSSLRMLSPTDGVRGIKQFVLETVVRAGGRPCPPTIVGVGIGGSADIAPLLAKRAILRRIDDRSDDPLLEDLEMSLTEALNATGIGPMGLGGDTTVLAVKACAAHCHTASLPVAVSMQCWAARRASARIYPDGSVFYSMEGF